MEGPASKEKAPIEVLDARTSDVEGIQNVFYKTWLATYPNEEAGVTKDDIEDRYKDAFSEDRLEKRRGTIEQLPTNERFIVARDASTVVGLCRVIKKESANQLQAIYVLPDYQGKGIGKRLWKEAQNFLDEEKDTFVEVVAYNHGAIEFYSRLGFEDTGNHSAKFTFRSGAVMPEIEMRLKAQKTA